MTDTTASTPSRNRPYARVKHSDQTNHLEVGDDGAIVFKRMLEVQTRQHGKHHGDGLGGASAIAPGPHVSAGGVEHFDLATPGITENEVVI
jgi:hypothetical protein